MLLLVPNGLTDIILKKYLKDLQFTLTKLSKLRPPVVKFRSSLKKNYLMRTRHCIIAFNSKTSPELNFPLDIDAEFTKKRRTWNATCDGQNVAKWQFLFLRMVRLRLDAEGCRERDLVGGICGTTRGLMCPSLIGSTNTALNQFSLELYTFSPQWKTVTLSPSSRKNIISYSHIFIKRLSIRKRLQHLRKGSDSYSDKSRTAGDV